MDECCNNVAVVRPSALTEAANDVEGERLDSTESKQNFKRGGKAKW